MWFRTDLFPKRRLHHVLPGPFPGRTLEVRLVSGRFDVTFWTIYFPPRGSMPTFAWKKMVGSIMHWLDERLKACPTRSTPMIYTDLNDDMGLDFNGCISTTAVGLHGSKPEGFTGSKFRSLLEKHDLTALNTFDKFQPTFFPAEGQGVPTRIDFLVAPQSFASSMLHCHTAARLGKELQLIPDKSP